MHTDVLQPRLSPQGGTSEASSDLEVTLADLPVIADGLRKTGVGTDHILQSHTTRL